MKQKTFEEATRIKCHIDELDICIERCKKEEIWQRREGLLVSEYTNNYGETHHETLIIPSSIFHDVVVFIYDTATTEKEVYEQLFQNL